MSAANSHKIWHYHVDNERALESNFLFVARVCKEQIRRGQTKPARLYVRNAALSLGALAEARLVRIAFYPVSGPSLDVSNILDGTVEDAWRRLIDEGFARKCNIVLGKIPSKLTFTDNARRTELHSIVTDYIVPLIQLRNALAHGQWVTAFVETRDRVSPDKMKLLNSLNLWHLIVLKNLLDKFGNLVEDLVITRYAFDRDFDKAIKDLHAARGRIQKGSHLKWESMLRDRWTRRPKLSQNQ